MRRDQAYLLDIVLAARRACQYLEGLTWEDFRRSELHQDAVMRPLGIIGEAAGRVSQETKEEHPEIPWQQMIGMRNRLVHEYFRVDLATVWETIKTDLPPLIELIGPLVPPEDES